VTSPRTADSWGRLLVVTTALSALLHVVVLTLAVRGARRFDALPIEKVYTVELTGGARPGGVERPMAKRSKGRTAPPEIGGAKAAPEAKPAPKPEAKPAPKPEAKPAPKPEAKPAPKPEAKPAPKPEVKPAPKPEAKPAPKPEAKPAPKPEVKPAPTPEVKPAPTPEAKPAPTPEAKPAPTPAAKPVSEHAAPTRTEPATPSTVPGPGAPPDSYDAAAARWRGKAEPAGAPGPLGTGGGDGGGGEVVGAEFIRYLDVVTSTMKREWVNPISDPSLVATVRFEIGSDGAVSGIRLGQSSGNAAYDAAAIRAVRAVRVLPPPPPQYVAQFREFQLVFRQEDEVP
jgi:TonB family protein